MADEMWRVGTDLNRLHERTENPCYRQVAKDYRFTAARMERRAYKLSSSFCAKDDIIVNADEAASGGG